jgi:Arc/MetJ family transcription regulator
MKTTVDIPDKELEEAIRHTGATTKREAVVTAITDFNRRRRLARVVARFGTFEHFLTHEELRQLREEG